MNFIKLNYYNYNESNKKEEINKLLIHEKKNKSNKNKILDYISFAKIIACYGVILLHLNNIWSVNLKKKNKWMIANIYETFFYYSVPFFVLCIGATLLNFNERYGLLEYNIKRFIKVFIPLIGWTVILYLYKVYILKNIRKENFDLSSFLNYFFMSKLYPIFSSLHTFLVTYMLIPLLVYVEKNNKIKIYTYYFFILLITQAAIPYILQLCGNKIIFIYKVNIGYLIYAFAGYIIHNQHFSNKIKIIIYILGILSFFIHLIGTQILYFKYKKIKRIHKGYLNLPSILYSCALFLFVKENSNFIFHILNRKYINNIGSLTLGPFFMHLTVSETIEKTIKFPKFFGFSLLLKSFIIFSICIFISSIIRKIPILKILVP